MFLQKLNDITNRFEGSVDPYMLQTPAKKQVKQGWKDTRRNSIEEVTTQDPSMAMLQSIVSKSELSNIG